MVSRNLTVIQFQKQDIKTIKLLFFTEWSECAIILTFLTMGIINFHWREKNTQLEFLSLVSRIEKYNIFVDIISRQLLYNLIAES